MDDRYERRRMDGTMRVVAISRQHELIKVDGRYYDYEPGKGRTLLRKMSGDREAKAVWHGRLRAEAMDA